MEFDPTLTITGIIAISAIVSPIFTSLINKYYEVKLQKINLIFPKKFEVYQNFAEKTNDLINNYNKKNLAEFHRAWDLLLLFTDFNFIYIDELLEGLEKGNNRMARISLKRIMARLRKQMKY